MLVSNFLSQSESLQSPCKAAISFTKPTCLGQHHLSPCLGAARELRERDWQSNEQINVSFLCVCPFIDHEFRHHIVKVSPRGSADYFDNVTCYFDNVMC